MRGLFWFKGAINQKNPSTSQRVISSLRGWYELAFTGCRENSGWELTLSRQEKLTRRFSDSPETNEPAPQPMAFTPGRAIDINESDFMMHPLWDILIETVRGNPLFAGRAGIIRETILAKNPNITAKELAAKMSIPLGEALVILAGSDLEK